MGELDGWRATIERQQWICTNCAKAKPAERSGMDG